MFPRLLVTPQFIQFSPGWQLSFANNNSNNYNQSLVCQQRSQMKVSFCWVCWPQLSMIIKIKFAARIACKSTATLQQCNSATCNAPALFDIHLNCFLYLYFFLSFEFQFELLVLHADNAVIHLHWMPIADGCRRNSCCSCTVALLDWQPIACTFICNGINRNGSTWCAKFSLQ